MSLLVSAFILSMAFVTSVVSGVFGMAGGLMLMGALALVLPVSAALVTHGLIQMAANGWRAVLHRRHLQWTIVGLYVVGSVTTAGVVALIAYAPSKPLLYLLLGLVPGLTWLPKRVVRLDAAQPVQAVACGALVTGLNLLAGVAGPLLDIFFIRTDLTRHRIVATKAATQVFSHLAKVVVYGAPLVKAGTAGLPPVWVFLTAIPLALVATVLGGRILDRLSDQRFISWTRYLTTAVGVLYLIQAAQLQFSAA
jgi:uncharacterized membrane protein YfcA